MNINQVEGREGWMRVIQAEGAAQTLPTEEEREGERMACSENHMWVRMVVIEHVGENGKRGVWRNE